MSGLLDPVTRFLSASLRTLGHRQAVLASNLANASTPGYTRGDVDFAATLRALWEDEGDDVPPSVAFVRSDGTEVDPELEAAELVQTALRMMTLSTLVSMKLEALRAAIAEGRR
jgi:flagellar basal-body rod protein FlgB